MPAVWPTQLFPRQTNDRNTVLPSSRPVVNLSAPLTASKSATKPAPTPSPAASSPAKSVPATAKAQPAPTIFSGSSTVFPKGGMTGEVPASSSKRSGSGVGSLFNFSTTSTSKEKQNSTDPAHPKAPSIFENLNASSTPVTFSSGGLFGSNTTTATPPQKHLPGTGFGGFGGSSNQKPAAVDFGKPSGNTGSSNTTKG